MPFKTLAHSTTHGVQLVVEMPEMSEKRFRCLCGVCHVVTGTQISLVWYVVASIISVTFGMRSTCTWLIVPIGVVALGAYAFITKRHKFLYPFLIITVVQQMVCILMAIIISAFAIFNFDTLKLIIAHTLSMREPPSTGLTTLVACGTASACVLLSFVHVWQAIIIYTCLEYFEREYATTLVNEDEENIGDTFDITTADDNSRTPRKWANDSTV